MFAWSSAAPSFPMIFIFLIQAYALLPFFDDSRPAAGPVFTGGWFCRFFL
jgi:hypothetical protein